VLSWKTPSGKAFPMPVEVKVGDKIVTAPMADNTGRIKVGDTVPVIVDPASKILRRQPYLEDYRPGRRPQDDAAKAAEAKKAEGRQAGQEVSLARPVVLPDSRGAARSWSSSVDPVPSRLVGQGVLRLWAHCEPGSDADAQPCRDHRPRRHLVAGALTAAVLMLGPWPGLEQVFGLSDKAAHAIAFGGLLAVSFLAFPRMRRNDLAIAAVVLGASVEVAQLFASTAAARSATWLADAVRRRRSTAPA
jgi:hypothetical protein